MVAVLVALLANSAAAAPSITSIFLYTENRSINEAGFPVGHRFILGAIVADDQGLGNIGSVTATPQAGGQPITLLPFNTGPLFGTVFSTGPGYAGQTGAWNITVTNMQGQTATTTTHVLDKPRFIPLARNIQFTDSSLTPTLSWNAVLFDDDADPDTDPVPVTQYRVRISTGPNGEFHESPPLATPSFTVPAGVLTAGQSVFFRIMAEHLDLTEENTSLENRSSTFVCFPLCVTGPFVFTENAGPNSAGIPVGQRFHLGAFVSDALGVPANIASVTATANVQGQPNYTLSPSSQPALGVFYGFFPSYTGQLGSWDITVTNQQGATRTVTTHALDKVRVIPLATNIAFSDTSLTPTITWDPVTFDDGGTTVPVDGYEVRILVGQVGTTFFRSAFLTQPSFTVPPGVLSPGQTVSFRIIAIDLDFTETGNPTENWSSTFTSLLTTNSFLVPIGNKTVAEGQPLTFTVQTLGGLNESLTLLADPLPPGATFNSQTGQFSWTPTGFQAGTYFVNFLVTDGEQTDVEEVRITVTEAIADTDGDGVVDAQDNCPEVPNPSQSNMDSDDDGDVCDTTPLGPTFENRVTTTTTVAPPPTSGGFTTDPSQPILITATVTFNPVPGEPYYVVVPTAYNLIPRVSRRCSSVLIDADRVPEGLPISFSDGSPDLALITTTSRTFTVITNLRDWYSTPGSLPPDTYNVTLEYVNFARDPDFVSGACVVADCFAPTWMGIVPAASQTLAIARDTVGAADALMQLIADVNALAVDSQVKTGLLSKLEAARDLVRKGNLTGACGKIKDFIQQVQAQSGKKLSAAEANELIAKATAISSLLACR